MSDDIYSSSTVNGVRLTWKELAEYCQAELVKAQKFQGILFDLDRNEHGRHEGDADGYDPSGISQGNPHLPSGSVIGYNISGRAYVRPHWVDVLNPEAWIAK